MHSVAHSKLIIFLSLCFFNVILNLKFSWGLPALSDKDRIKCVIEEILDKRFNVAEELLLDTYNYQQIIPEIVKAIYSGSEEKIDILVAFSKATQDFIISFEFLTALRNEMKKYGHRNPYKLMHIVKTLESEVIYYTDSENMRNKSRAIIDEIKVDNEDSIKDILKAAMILNNFQNNTEIRKLCDTIFDLDEKSSDIIMQKLVNETSSIVAGVRIADNIMHGCSKVPQIVSGLLCLFLKLFNSNDMNNEAILRIANYISKLKLMDGYNTMSKSKKFDVNEFREKLPSCARHLNFANEVCIQNRRSGEYLYASGTSFYLKRRSVFTCDVDLISDDGAWKVEKTSDKYYFRNEAQKKDYLYASTNDELDTKKRHIQTWILEGSPPDSTAWTVELTGEYCYLKNQKFNEYLYSSNKIKGSNDRNVFAAVNKRLSDDDTDFQWQVQDCA